MLHAMVFPRGGSAILVTKCVCVCVYLLNCTCVCVCVCVYVLFAFDRLGEFDWSISAGTQEEEANDIKRVKKNTIFTYKKEEATTKKENQLILITNYFRATHALKGRFQK